MSYSGYTEYLCETGHRSTFDCWEDRQRFCWCGEPMAYAHGVDTTNGYDGRYGGTSDAKVFENSSTDTWHEDHYGNKFARKHTTYGPRGKQWRKLQAIEAGTAKTGRLGPTDESAVAQAMQPDAGTLRNEGETA